MDKGSSSQLVTSADKFGTDPTFERADAPTKAADTQKKLLVAEEDRCVNGEQKKRLRNIEGGDLQAKKRHVAANASLEGAASISDLEQHDARNGGDSEARNRSDELGAKLNGIENAGECAAVEDWGDDGGADKPQSSYAGSSGEEADIDTCSGGSDEAAARQLHKRRAAVVCQDGHVPPAVDQHEGDCMVASKLLTLWNARPIAGKMIAVVGKEVARAEGAKVTATVIC